MSNAASVVYNAQAEAGWDDETTLAVVCDVLMAYVDVDTIAQYLNAPLEEDAALSAQMRAEEAFAARWHSSLNHAEEVDWDVLLEP